MSFLGDSEKSMSLSTLRNVVTYLSKYNAFMYCIRLQLNLSFADVGNTHVNSYRIL